MSEIIKWISEYHKRGNNWENYYPRLNSIRHTWGYWQGLSISVDNPNFKNWFDNSNHIKIRKKYKIFPEATTGLFLTPNFYWTKYSKAIKKLIRNKITTQEEEEWYQRLLKSYSFEDGYCKRFQRKTPYKFNPKDVKKETILFDKSNINNENLFDKHNPYRDYNSYIDEKGHLKHENLLGNDLQENLSYAERKLRTDQKAIKRNPRVSELIYEKIERDEDNAKLWRYNQIKHGHSHWFDSNGNLNYKEATKRIHNPKWYKYPRFLNPELNPFLKQPSINEGVLGFWYKVNMYGVSVFLFSKPTTLEELTEIFKNPNIWNKLTIFNELLDLLTPFL